jgi:hypothetical protein
MIIVSLCNSGGELDSRTVHTPGDAMEAAVSILNHMSALFPGDKLIVSGTYDDEGLALRRAPRAARSAVPHALAPMPAQGRVRWNARPEPRPCYNVPHDALASLRTSDGGPYLAGICSRGHRRSLWVQPYHGRLKGRRWA